ncbi:hypothetical protein [Nocardioides sp.]|uniref:hypothetical protein n=1 Tax=Nocardioides sp. TaxID=35761 RepID=UPI003563A9C5
MTDPQDPTSTSDPEVGNVAEEAVKLFGALSDWAREHGGDLGQGVSDIAGHAAAAAREVNEHLATGSAECTYCPICRTVHLARQASPEVRAHLSAAASSLLQAAAGILATAVPDDAAGGPGRAPGRGQGRPGTGVEHIDLDDDPGWPEGEDR